MPPEGFRWVEPAEETAGLGKRRRRWWWIAAALVAVLALVVGGLLVWRSRQSGGGSGTAGPLLGTPKDLLVSIPLDRQPVPTGWQVKAADIGLPPGTELGQPFAGSGDKAFFVTDNCHDDCPHPVTSWVYGIDIRTGKPLFAPVQLNGYHPECHGNGPAVAVCLRKDGDAPTTAWVIDLDRGAITFTGPTMLTSETATEVGEKYGETRLVETVMYGGVYGVGPHAERTWFAAGSGVLDTGYLKVNDIPSLTLTAEAPLNGGSRVFSVVDGKDLTPAPPAGATKGKATVYAGGFAYNYEMGPDSNEVVFYDTSGRQLAHQEFERAVLADNPAMPTLLSATPAADSSVGLSNKNWKIYTAAGQPALFIPATDIVANFKTIGTTLLVQNGADLDTVKQKAWKQWDLATAKPGPECSFDLDSYVGSDGHVIVTGSADFDHTVGIDLSTCRTLWQFSKFIHVWKLGTSLIEENIENDLDNTLALLRAPT
jgi:hypothetical protein